MKTTGIRENVDGDEKIKDNSLLSFTLLEITNEKEVEVVGTFHLITFFHAFSFWTDVFLFPRSLPFALSMIFFIFSCSLWK